MWIVNIFYNISRLLVHLKKRKRIVPMRNFEFQNVKADSKIKTLRCDVHINTEKR